MNLSLIVVYLFSIIGLFKFSQFMFEIWDRKYKERNNKGDFHY